MFLQSLQFINVWIGDNNVFLIVKMSLRQTSDDCTPYVSGSYNSYFHLFIFLFGFQMSLFIRL